MSGVRSGWLHDQRGGPTPADLTSDRMRDIIGRALLTPGALNAMEVQELAASTLTYLVRYADVAGGRAR